VMLRRTPIRGNINPHPSPERCTIGPPPPQRVPDRVIRSGRRGPMSLRPTQMRVLCRRRLGRNLHASSEAEDLYVLAFLTTFYKAKKHC